MAIFIVRGPEACDVQVPGCRPLPGPLMTALVLRALDACISVAQRSCRSEQELLDTLCAADHCPGDILLLAPAACVHSPRLQRLLPRLHNAYVEVHEDDPHAPQARLPANLGHRLGVAQGYCVQSYALALELALEHLCCSDAGERVHVGT